MEKIPLLTSEDIEVKVKQVTKSGALLLLYKSSRTDRKILDQLVGPMNWTSDYKVVRIIYIVVSAYEKMPIMLLFGNGTAELKAPAMTALRRKQKQVMLLRELGSSGELELSFILLQ